MMKSRYKKSKRKPRLKRRRFCNKDFREPRISRLGLLKKRGIGGLSGRRWPGIWRRKRRISRI